MYSKADRGDYKNKNNVKKGRNTLIVKTPNKYGDYTFALNICEVERDPLYYGNRVAGLKFYIDESGTGTELSTSINDLSMESSLKSYPNPARDYAKISFELSKSRTTTLKLYDLNGRMVKSICNEKLSAGMHEFTWMLDNDDGSPVSKGVYFCRMISGKQNSVLKLIVE